MRYIHEGRQALPEARWSELTGGMSLERAESYIERPPAILGDPGTVTIDRAPHGGFAIYRLEDEEAA